MAKNDQDLRETAARVKRALASCESQTVVAEHCGVSPQAITGWIKTGRIGKKSATCLAKLSGYRLLWLLTGDGPAREGGVMENERPAYVLPLSTRELLGHVAAHLNRADPTLRDDVVRLITRYLETPDPSERLLAAIEAMLDR